MLGKKVKYQGKHDKFFQSKKCLDKVKLAYRDGRYEEAVTLAFQLVKDEPNDPESWIMLWAASRKLGKMEQALSSIQKVVEISPDDANACSNLGIAYKDCGQFFEAEKSYRHAISLNPEHAISHSNLGNLLIRLERPAEALISYQRSVEIDSQSVQGILNIGCALRLLGRLEEAAEKFRRAIELSPEFVDAHSNLGVVLKELGRLSESELSLRNAIVLDPNHAAGHNNLGVVLRAMGRDTDSEVSFRKAISVQPSFANAYSNLGNVLRESRRLSEAEAFYRKALLLQSDCPDALGNLGVVLAELGRFSEAKEIFRKAVASEPGSAEHHYNLGNVLKDLGHLWEAVESYNHSLTLKPEYTDAHTNLLFLIAYHGLKTSAEYLTLARAWETTVQNSEGRMAAQHRKFKRMPLSGRRLRVGYVSGDFRQHAVTYFIERIFRQHDRNRVELYAYSSQATGDATTERLKTLVDCWNCITGDSEISRSQIEKDGIDILIDLSGHTGRNRLDVFARRAAPVQAHYLGYHASTGLTEMDYWIGDAILTPPETDSFFCETVWRLPRIWVAYSARLDAPSPNWRSRSDGKVCLGSLNNLSKLNTSTLQLWARVLQAVPRGHLVLKTKELSDASNRQRIFHQFLQMGITGDRITLNDATSTPDWPSHMAFYDNLDIALDPVGGVGGGTTTCDALWMGVPVITLLGSTMGQRMSASMLHAIGQDDWIAQNETQYIEKVVALANDLPRRTALRLSQRERMRVSPLCDAAGLTYALEDAYFAMFNNWYQKKQGIADEKQPEMA